MTPPTRMAHPSGSDQRPGIDSVSHFEARPVGDFAGPDFPLVEVCVMDPGKFAVIFPDSAFVPVVLGFFGLGTGYLIYGPQELLRAPRRNADVDRAMGVWGIFMPGLCQLLAGIYLFVGLTWFQVFHDKALYMAAPSRKPSARHGRNSARTAR
ncbi:hypothetical protein ACIBBB_05545 [Streptomyces sp. NPDC051217]|uniref:hypothetical protein n=1 Tax=Streptomyces sp. NPDC051217 TaxID=3365644 RepID=UPI0037A4A820